MLMAVLIYKKPETLSILGFINMKIANHANLSMLAAFAMNWPIRLVAYNANFTERL